MCMRRRRKRARGRGGIRRCNRRVALDPRHTDKETKKRRKEGEQQQDGLGTTRQEKKAIREEPLSRKEKLGVRGTDISDV